MPFRLRTFRASCLNDGLFPAGIPCFRCRGLLFLFVISRIVILLLSFFSRVLPFRGTFRICCVITPDPRRVSIGARFHDGSASLSQVTGGLLGILTYRPCGCWCKTPTRLLASLAPLTLQRSQHSYLISPFLPVDDQSLI